MPRRLAVLSSFFLYKSNAEWPTAKTTASEWAVSFWVRSRANFFAEF
jgi:hypothetical protein